MGPAPPLPPAVQSGHLLPEQGAVQGVHQGLGAVFLSFRHSRLRHVPVVHAAGPVPQLRHRDAELLYPLLRSQRLPGGQMGVRASAEGEGRCGASREPPGA